MSLGTVKALTLAQLRDVATELGLSFADAELAARSSAPSTGRR